MCVGKLGWLLSAPAQLKLQLGSAGAHGSSAPERSLLICRPALPPQCTGRGTTEAAAPAERHYSLTGQHGVWARARRLANLDLWFDSLDEIFEAGDNVDLTVRA